MSKEKNKSNKKKNNNKVTDTNITKATKKEEKSKIKVYDTMEEAEAFEEELEIEENEEVEKEFNQDEDFEVDEAFEEDEDEEFDEVENLDVEDEFDNDEDEFDNEFDNDEDFENEEEFTEDEELEIEEEIIETKPKKEKKEKKKKEENTSKEKIKKIEKLAKEKKVKTKSNNKKFEETLLLFEKYSTQIYSFIGGILLTTLIAFIIWPDRIAALKNGEEPVVKVGKENYTADELYEMMKDYYSVSILLDDIDDDLLTKLYPEDEEMTNAVNEDAEYYLNMYEQYYGYTEEQFLESNGFSSYNAFLDYLRLDYRRNKYLDEYVEKNLTDKEIEDYYNDNVYGDINTQHVLVEISSSEDDGKLSDEDAKKLAEEIITKLNDGTSWETIQEDYKDKITYEDLGYQAWDASLEESFLTALKEMEDNTYSEEPVKTSYGYHVIYRLDQKEAPTLKEMKETIINKLVTNKKSEDANLLYKALIALREENKIDFKDTVMKDKYETYTKQYE